MSDTFTVEQADALLPRIEPLVKEARRVKREIEMIAVNCQSNDTILKQERPRLEKHLTTLTALIENIENLGGYVKDLDVGIIDFLSAFEGRDIFLSWKLGEQQVTHWHELDETFAQRQTIIDLKNIFQE